eukprot:PhM_4_TR5049/c0_g1_i1/m.101430
MEDNENNLLVPQGYAIGDYLVSHMLGRGSYGIVYSATSLVNNATVALKIIKKQPAYTRQAAIEVGVLCEMQQRFLHDSRYDHVVPFLESFDHNGHMCLVFAILSHTVHAEVFGSSPTSSSSSSPNPNARGLTLSRVQAVCQHILRGLSVLEEMGYMHCDVKPENTMVDTTKPGSPIRVIDFGSVRALSRNDYFDIQSLWYRAPEVIMQQPYDTRIDTWSVGCTAVEVFTCSAIFTGSNPQDQLSKIMAYARPGAVQDHLLSRPVACHQQSEATPYAMRMFADFVARCLDINVASRPTPSQALAHPFLQLNLANPNGATAISMSPMPMRMNSPSSCDDMMMELASFIHPISLGHSPNNTSADWGAASGHSLCGSFSSTPTQSLMVPISGPTTYISIPNSGTNSSNNNSYQTNTNSNKVLAFSYTTQLPPPIGVPQQQQQQPMTFVYHHPQPQPQQQPQQQHFNVQQVAYIPQQQQQQAQYYAVPTHQIAVMPQQQQQQQQVQCNTPRHHH